MTMSCGHRNNDELIWMHRSWFIAIAVTSSGFKCSRGMHQFTVRPYFGSPAYQKCQTKFTYQCLFFFRETVCYMRCVLFHTGLVSAEYCMHCTVCAQPIRSFPNKMAVNPLFQISSATPPFILQKRGAGGASLLARRPLWLQQPHRLDQCKWLLLQSIPVTGENPE